MAGRALAGRALASRRLALTGHRPELDPPRRLESALAQVDPGLAALAPGPAQRQPALAQLEAAPGRRPQVAELERGQKPAPAQAGTDSAPRREDGPAHSAPARHRGWLVPFASGALTMVVLAAAVGSVALLHHNHSPRKPAPTKPRAAQAAPMPAQMPSSALFQALTNDIQTQNETAFLSQVAPAARPAVQTWWENLQAIGFTSGAITPASGDLATVPSSTRPSRSPRPPPATTSGCWTGSTAAIPPLNRAQDGRRWRAGTPADQRR
jgi:hypothetical protein